MQITYPVLLYGSYYPIHLPNDLLSKPPFTQ